jgi:hypothetical protein
MHKEEIALCVFQRFKASEISHFFQPYISFSVLGWLMFCVAIAERLKTLNDLYF